MLLNKNRINGASCKFEGPKNFDMFSLSQLISFSNYTTDYGKKDKQYLNIVGVFSDQIVFVNFVQYLFGGFRTRVDGHGAEHADAEMDIAKPGVFHGEYQVFSRNEVLRGLDQVSIRGAVAVEKSTQ